MTTEPKGCSRREFFKVGAAAGVGSLLNLQAEDARAGSSRTLSAATRQQVPTRPFGRTGVEVSTLALGGMFDIAANQLMLRQALNWGVTYWDTADCYQRGSERGIGKYFGKYPQERQRVFLVTKSDAREPDKISRLLDRSLERMQTDYIDLYLIHGIRGIDVMDADIRRWAERAKAAGKIRLFGFSTHSNMEACLLGAARLGWIDGIMMTYNFRNMHRPEMRAAIAACTRAGIGLTAMKTQGGSSWFSLGADDPAGVALTERFVGEGFTEEQAKLKAVWSQPEIASICSQMDSFKILETNVAAAADPAALSAAQQRHLQTYARRSQRHYCTGCAHICEAAVTEDLPISDVMRCHMYCAAYGRSEWARDHFRKFSPHERQQMAAADYTLAERHCPQNMPIGRLMRVALEAFS